jgi:NAD-dependent dihydropyrimidine dehydrogenase PreA subunit/coenzyme F420-reducing hydrogenase delta subunit
MSARNLIDKALSLKSGPEIIPLRRRCVLDRYWKASCRACVEVCRHEAIKVGQGVEVLEACTGCGACVAACPTGALVMRKPSDRKLHEAISALLKKGEKVVRLACSSCTEDAREVQLPSLNCVTEAMILWAFSNGAEGVEIKRCTCPECCKLPERAPLWEKTFAFARAILHMVGIPEDHLQIIDTVPVGENECPGKKGLNRREALATLCSDVCRTVGSLLRKPSGANGSVRTSGANEGLPANRQYLHTALVALPLKYPDTPSPDGFPLAELTVSTRCRDCNVCTTLCPTNALSWEDWEDGKSLLHRSWHCAGCGVCAATCPAKAIAVKKPAPLWKVGTRTPKVLIHVAPSTCPVCREKGYGSTPESCCLPCSLGSGRLRM